MADAAFDTNNSRMRGMDRGNVSGALMGSGAMSLGLTSPKGLNIESMPAFTINTTKGIPNKVEMRSGSISSDRMDSLMRMPSHKSGTTKFDKSTHARTIAPLTSEDVNQFCNLNLMGTLR